jgi:hypothetical protein
MIRAAGLCVVWSLSIAALWVPDSARWIAGLSRTGLAALPWIAYLGLPQVAGDAERSRAPFPWTAALLALPPVALSARVDIAAGSDAREVLFLAATSAVLAALASWAASGARSSGAAGRHAAAWLALVAGAPLLCAVLEHAGAPAYGSAPRWLALIARASPLEWTWRELALVGGRDAPAGASAVSVSVLAPLCVSAALVLVARSRRAPIAGVER